jgi:hypothetical protein
MKPICKIINGKPNYARKFSLAAINEIKRSGIQCMVGDAKISQAELKAIAGENASAEEIGEAAQMHLKMPMVSVMMQKTVLESMRMRHSICNADGVLLYKSVEQMEQIIDPDDVDALLELVAEANPVKTIAAELEEAEKN